MISHRSYRQAKRSVTAVALAMLVALLLPALSAAAQGVSDSSGPVPAETSVSLNVPGFDASLGELVSVDLIVSGSFEARVLSASNPINDIADVIVLSEIDVCAHQVPAGETTTYLGCLGTGDLTTIFFTADVLREAFTAVGPRSATSGGGAGVASGAGSMTLLDPGALAPFLDAKGLDFAASSTVRSEATANGHFGEVSVETLADITISAQYGYIALSLDAANGTYVVTNTGNTRMVEIDVTNSAGETVCSIYALDPGAAEGCTGSASGAVGASGAAWLNRSIRVSSSVSTSTQADSAAVVAATQNSVPAADTPGAFGFASADIQPSTQATATNLAPGAGAAAVPTNDDASSDASTTAATTAATTVADSAPAAEAPPAAANPAAAAPAPSASVASAASTEEETEPKEAPSPASSTGSVVRVAYQEDSAPFLAYTGGDAESSAMLGLTLSGLGLVLFAASRAVRKR